MTSEEQLILLLGRGQFPSDARRRALSLLALPLDWDLIVERVLAEGVDPLFSRNLNWVRRYSVHRVCCDGPETLQTPKPNKAKNPINKGGDQRATLNAIDQTSEVSDQRPDVGGRGNAKNSERNNAINAINATNAINALSRLRSLAKVNAFRNTLLVEELVRVLNLLSDAGIPAISLKGPALAQELYGDPSLRCCVDLDILVPRSLVGRAVNLLRTDGYKGEFGPGFFADLLLRHDIEYALRRDARGFEFMVELHWGVLWGGKAEESVTDQLWADAYPTTVFGAPAYALSAEWQVLFLAAHAARHQWQGLKWLVDLHELYAAPKFDWDKLDKKAKLLGWQEILRISFLACQKLFETPIPEKYLAGELPAWVKLFPDYAPAPLNGAFFATHLMRQPLDKLRYAARVLLVPTLAELRLVALPSFLAFLYYPLRPARLGWKWVLGIRC